MSVEEAKYLLKTHRIVLNKLLGQNFMVDTSIYPKLANYAAITSEDTILDAGAGLGFLTKFLAFKSKRVIAVEKDPQFATVLREQVKGLTNVTIVEGDVLKTTLPSFNKAISFPPYYLSSKFVIWLLEHDLDCSVLIVQKEFSDRLVAPIGSKDYGWLAVTASQAAEVKLLDSVPKWMFYPEPEVASIVIAIRPWVEAPFKVKDKALFRRMVKWLFTERNKRLENAIVPFIRSELKLDKANASKIASGIPQRERRVRELTPKDFGAIANALSQ